MQHAFVTLVEQSTQQMITIEEVRNILVTYQEEMKQMGKQLAWAYEEASFPYEMVLASNTIHLQAKQDRYHSIYIGVENAFIQITLPTQATHGDKNKANEFSKFLAKKLAGELQLFNGRTMYFYKR